MHYIVSLKHTRKDEDFITLWGPNNRGYFYTKAMVGVYDNIEKGYHDSDSSFPVKVEDAEGLFINIQHFGETISAIPNCNAALKKLGLKWNKGKLERRLN